MHAKSIALLVAISAVFSLAVTAMKLNCSKTFREHTRFYLMRTCQRSLEPIVGLANANSFRECETITKSYQGLAFNYSPNERRKSLIGSYYSSSGNGTLFPGKSSRKHILDQPEEFYNCHALACPEVGNLTKIVNDSRFDYYTLYAGQTPPINATCIPQIGLFQFYNVSTNYSWAFETCVKESHGALAHILSETRTNRIGNLLRSGIDQKKIKSRFAYIGLNYSLPEIEFYTSEWENLQCFGYRAWAPGHPKKFNQTCVALRNDNSWITMSCETAMPFICEVYPSGPYLKNRNFCSVG